MPGDAIGAAIEAAEIQLQRLLSSGFETYAHGLTAYGELCDAACKTFSADPFRHDEARFAELIALDERIAAELQRQKQEVSRKLTGLRRGRHAAGAYLSAPPPTRAAVALAASRTRPRLEA